MSVGRGLPGEVGDELPEETLPLEDKLDLCGVLEFDALGRGRRLAPGVVDLVELDECRDFGSDAAGWR